MSSPSSRATASESGARACVPWFFLDRAARVTDPGEMASDADVVLQLVPPPAVSTVSVSRALLPEDVDWDTAPCRAKGTDAWGHVLLAFRSPRAPGESYLLICLPVPSSGGGVAKGKACFLPAFPEETLGLALSSAAPAGILADRRRANAFFVVQLQTPSSSRPASVLCYSSEQSAWSVKEVPGDRFHAKSVVSHDRGHHGDAILVFADVNRQLLLFNPSLSMFRYVNLPDASEPGGGGEVDVTIASSEGRVVCLMFYDVLLELWWLSDEDCWHLCFELPCDEVLTCDQRLMPLRGIQKVDLHPNRMTRLFFTMGPADAGACFCVEVMPMAMVLRRVRLIGELETRGCLHSVVWYLTQDAARKTLMESLRACLDAPDSQNPRIQNPAGLQTG